MSFKNILMSSSRLCVPAQQWCQRSITTASSPLYFRLTQCLGAEPLKKKKRLDPMIVRQREERKKKKIEKMIRRLEKNAGQLKPIDELEVPRNILQEIDIRKRREVAISEEEEERRASLAKEWCQYRYKQHMAEVTMIDKMIAARDRALEELRQESEDLWFEAIQVDATLLPFKAKGPVSTPPIKDYDAPDGEYYNITRNWD
ncbi:39S ribosomal protein L40, mitochondrial-like [Eriocheir sinensis]|uniref:39S ribosomal protein L40, mitochondrial-like n=1 Tax=Eriocheir sinensis TaxID=95602 RepID=UPI0021C7EA10|nr:39S ribosomal protein L40, mitochondrial-like [Eriocheir sinensis]